MISNKLNLTVITVTITILITISTTVMAQPLIHEESFSVNSNELLTINSDCGDIKISSGSDDLIEIKVYGNDNAEEDIEYNFERTSDGVLIEAEKDGSWGFFSRIKLKFEVIVPQNFQLKLKTSGGDINCFGVDGEKKINTSGGDIKLKSTKGNSHVSTSGGDIEINNLIGNLKGSTSGGDIETDKIVGNVDVSTSGGDIKIKSEDGFVEASTSGGDVKLYYSGLNNGIKLKSTGGDIDLYLPSDISGDLELRTSGGDIDVKISKLSADKISKSKIIGKLNGGGKQIFATTSGGDVTIFDN